jgi:hypothetical protein
VADINDRLERLNRREQLARLAHQRPLRGAPAEGLGEDFLEVLEAVARAVQRHPALSVMVAAIDGRPGRTVVRVTERDGAVETALVAAPTRAGEPGRHAEPTGQPASAASAVAPVLWSSLAPPAASGASGAAAAPAAPAAAAAWSAGAAPVARAAPVTSAASAGASGWPAGRAPTDDQPDTGASDLVTLPPDTSQVVARLAQLLRDDPTLASGWTRDR